MRMQLALLALAIVLAGALGATLSAKTGFYSHSDYATATDIRAIASMSEVIVVGTVVAEGGLRNVARDPNDHTKPDESLTVWSQDYTFLVEETLKGSVPSRITITSAKGGVVINNGQEFEFARETFVPLHVGSRYALMLRAIPLDRDLYGFAVEPSRFELGAGAAVRSNWPEASRYFPPVSTEVFLTTLRAAASAR